MIYIGQPQLSKGEIFTRLTSIIKIDDEKIEIWIEVKHKYEQYLCHERADAFIIGLLNYAMKNKHDIISECPIGEDIFYQLDSFFIDTLVMGDSRLYRTKILADIDKKILSCDNAVGTGISCGIDSLHVVANNTQSICSQHNITHLCFNNVGSHGEGKKAKELYEGRKRIAEAYCDEYGFDFVESNSNIMDVIEQDHLLTHTYTSCFAILALQKLYAYYYYASSNIYPDFSVLDNASRPCSYYELLSLPAFSTENLKIHSEGATSTRIEKTIKVTDFAPSYKYLNVCVKEVNNCGVCEKCLRTLLSLEALGKLSLYSSVFNIESYNKNRNNNYAHLYLWYRKKDKSYNDIYKLLKNNITIYVKLKTIYMHPKTFLGTFVPKSRFRSLLKKCFN